MSVSSLISHEAMRQSYITKEGTRSLGVETKEGDNKINKQQRTHLLCVLRITCHKGTRGIWSQDA